MVGRFVQQQQVRVGEQRGGQRDAHAPAAGEFFHGPRLRWLVEAQTGQDGGGAGGGGVGADGDQAFVDFGQTVRVGGFGFVEQCQPFGVSLQHGCQQGCWPLRRFLPHRGHAGAAGQADIAAVEGDFPGDSAQQCGFAGAVTPDEADASARIDGEVGAAHECASAHADGEVGDNQEAHARGFSALPRRQSTPTSRAPASRCRRLARPRIAPLRSRSPFDPSR